jgi:hypothetical protein
MMTCPHSLPETTFTPEEQQALSSLRTQHENDCDGFSERERAPLQFVRWLYQTGRLTS